MNSRKVIEMISVSKQFGTITAVDKLSVELYEGEILGLLGPNGAGKSTTIKMLCGLLKPDSGTIQYEGVSIGSKRTFLNKVGFCPQENVFWPKLSCMEQMVYMAEMYNLKRKTAVSRSEKLLENLGLYERRNSLAQNLSGGMKRRLNICLALVHDPDVLILDEPEAGLDPQSRVLVRDFIHSLTARKSVILTTHNMDEAERLAGRVAIIDHGRLLVSDTPSVLKRIAGESEILSMQIDPVGEIKIAAVISSLEQLAGRLTYNPPELLFYMPGVIEKTGEIISLLNRAGIETGDIHVRKPSLEDVFIALTGRKLRD